MKVDIYRSKADPLKFMMVPSGKKAGRTVPLSVEGNALPIFTLYLPDVRLGPDHSAVGEIRKRGYAVLDTRSTGQFFALPP